MFAANTLVGRVAFITGGASGIGLEIATQYASLGASVMLASRNRDRLDAAVSSLSELGPNVAACQMDVRDYDQVSGALERTIERFGALDILVNNAAGNFHCPSASLSPNGFRTVVDIDLNGAFNCCRAAYEALKASSHGGNIISIVTMQGVTGWPGAAHAAAAKAGILALSRTLAVEWGGDNVRVNTISPGPIGDTEGVRRMYEDTGLADLQRRRVALGRLGRRIDIANAAVYLASDLGSYMTGENMIVDGGRWLTYVAS